MLLDLLFSIPASIVSWILGFLQIGDFSLVASEGFRLIFGYGVFLMGDTTFLLVTGCILFWTTLQFTVSLIKFVIWLFPFIG